MNDLRNAISDPDVLISLSPEELGAKILFLLRKVPTNENRGMFNLNNLALEFNYRNNWRGNIYDESKMPAVKEAFFEAWAWLESQGLLVWPETGNGSMGWKKLSRRAKSFEDESEFLAFATGKYLRPEMLHKDIAMPVWKAFSRGEFDVAIFQAMKAVEIAVQQSCNLPSNIYGVKLMREAFNVERGPLTDLSLEVPEREALMALFAGAIGWFKNPQSHKNVGVSDAREAIETIMFANRLLNIVDAKVKAKKVGDHHKLSEGV
jgi:uncharacterized protein (TIGR02391 family)